MQGECVKGCNLQKSYCECKIKNPFVKALHKYCAVVQIRDEYEAVKDIAAPDPPSKRAAVSGAAAPSLGGAQEITAATEDAAASRSTTARLLDNITAESQKYVSTALYLHAQWHAQKSSCKLETHNMKLRSTLSSVHCYRANAGSQQQQLVLHGQSSGVNKALLPVASGGHKEYVPSAAVAKRLPSKWPRPAWHPPWRLFRVISGHLG